MGSDGALAAAARFGAQPGTAGFTGSAGSGSRSTGASTGGVSGIKVLRDEVQGIDGFFVDSGGSGEAAGGTVFSGSGAAGVTDAGGTVAGETLAVETLSVRTVADGTADGPGA